MRSEALGESYKEAAHMRDKLENLYFGNITPNDQIVKSGTALKKAMEQSAECEEKLTALLEDKEKTLLLRLINAENEIGSTMAWRTSSWVSAWGYA